MKERGTRWKGDKVDANTGSKEKGEVTECVSWWISRMPTRGSSDLGATQCDHRHWERRGKSGG